MSFDQTYNFFGVHSGWGEQIHETEFAAEVLFKYIKNKGLSHNRDCNFIDVKPAHTLENTVAGVGKESLPLVCEAANELYKSIVANRKNEFPIVIGGDHSIAVGTWAAITQIHKAQEKFGLIWVDAHMDAHTYETSPSKAYHGMPLAVLLGYGENELVNVGKFKPKISPEHLVLIGIRSYEIGEKKLLEKLGVRIMYMEEVKQRGFSDCFDEALQIASQGTKGFGASIDMDAFDPIYAPGVGSPAQNGLIPKEVLQELEKLTDNKEFKALEIVEYNPKLDIRNKTLRLMYDILNAMKLC